MRDFKYYFADDWAAAKKPGSSPASHNQFHKFHEQGLQEVDWEDQRVHTTAALHLFSIRKPRVRHELFRMATKEINELNAKLKQMALDAVEEDKKKSDNLLHHYEEVVGQLKQQHLKAIGTVRNLAEKDKKISTLQASCIPYE